MALIILRCIFVLVSAGLGIFFLQSDLVNRDSPGTLWMVFGGMMLLSFGIIALDVAIPTEKTRHHHGSIFRHDHRAGHDVRA